MRNVSDKSCTEKQNKQLMFKNTFFFFRKSYRLLDEMEKFGRAAQATDESMAHAHCVLNN